MQYVTTEVYPRVKIEDENQSTTDFFDFRLIIPQQNNSYDCGIYVIEYVERFLI